MAFLQTVSHLLLEARFEIITFIVAASAHMLLFRGRAKQVKQGKRKPGKDDGKPAADRGASTEQEAKLLAAKASIAAADLEGAAGRVAALADLARDTESPSFALQGLLQQLASLAITKHAVPELLSSFAHRRSLAEGSLEAALQECARRGDQEAMVAIKQAGRDAGVDINAGAFGALIRGAATSTEALERFTEANARGLTLDIAHQVILLKRLGAEHRLEDMFKVFNACLEKPGCLYNTVIDACVDHKETEAAERLVKEAVDAGVADVITSNTIIKAHLRSGKLGRARAVLEAMRTAGVAPNVVTFNEFLDAAVERGGCCPWSIIDEISECGLKPNAVTCSILLKTLQPQSREQDVERIASLLESFEESEIDEVLLSSVCEAGIRARRPDFLRHQLRRQRTSQRVLIKGAPAFGSVIRAYGFIRDVGGIWDTWRDMRARRILPTSITLGCMVEAVVTNVDPEAGHQLIREALADAEVRPLVNAVIYCSVLKGFSHQKRFDRMWAVYQELLVEKMQCTIATFNTMVDACARCGEMGRITDLLHDMDQQGIKANVITYGAIIKGYCQDSKVEKALDLFHDMKTNTNLQPDEITYNTLLDGCSRFGLWDRGISLLREMEASGVPPSNFTLSVLVKLAHRSRKLENAFDMCEVISNKYNIRLNIHVYNNLINACVGCGQFSRGIRVFGQAIGEKVRPDARTYSILLRGCVSHRQPDDAAGLIRAAAGLRGAHPAIGRDTAFAKLSGGLSSDLVSEVLEGISYKCGEQLLAVQLLRDLQGHCANLDPRLKLRLATKQGY